jgi:Outer membrane protein beta-barrel domain
MRKPILFALFVSALALPAAAQAPQPKTQVQGFGGMTVGTSTFGSAMTPTFGGSIAADLTPNLQAIGEFGRMNDIKSPVFDLLDFTGIGAHVSAWYGEAGVRFIATKHSIARPYADATFGFAKLSTGVSGLSGETDEYVNAALNLINATRPMLGVGGGVQLGGGPVVFDMGYRYKQISAGNGIASLLNLNQPYHINELRIGVGVKF